MSEPMDEFVKDYLNKSDGNKEIAIDLLIKNQKKKLAASGFLTGLGGLITLPITIPTDISSSLYVQIRMIAAIAYIYGYDINSDAVKTLTYTTLLGIEIFNIAKEVGVRVSEKVAMNLLKKIPGKVLTKINQKIGFRFITKFGTKGIVNLWKVIPVVPGAVNAGLNFFETDSIAKRALKEFAKQ